MAYRIPNQTTAADGTYQERLQAWLRENVTILPLRTSNPRLSKREWKVLTVGLIQGVATGLLISAAAGGPSVLVHAAAGLAWVGFLLALRWDR